MSELQFMRRRKLILKFTPRSVVLEVLAFLALLASLLFAERLYPGLAPVVPTKFAADGSVLATGVKELTLLHPILAVFVYVILFCVNIIIRQSCPPDRPLPVLTLVLDAIAAAKTLFLAWQAALTWYALRLRPAPGWPLWVFLAALAVLAAVTALLIRAARAART